MEEERVAGPRSTLHLFTLTLEYTDYTGEECETEKDVSHFTYDKYDTHIPVAYRDKRPYDVLTTTESFR